MAQYLHFGNFSSFLPIVRSPRVLLTAFLILATLPLPIAHAFAAQDSGGDVRARNDAYAVQGNSSLKIEQPGVLHNDSRMEGRMGLEAGALMALMDDEPAHGKVELHQDGSFVYTPEPGYLGLDTFTYQAKNGDTVSSAATVTIRVIDPTINRKRLDLSIFPLENDEPVEPGAGMDVYNTDATDQTVTFSGIKGTNETAKFQIYLSNHHPNADSFVLKAPNTSKGWILHYFDAAKGGNDITPALTSPKGWISGMLQSGGFLDLRLEASPDPTTIGPVTSSSLITATSNFDKTISDAVKATYGFQRIAKLQYSLDQGVKWEDAPTVASGKSIAAQTQCMVGIRAVRLDDSLPWPFEPEKKPIWDHDGYWLMGETIWVQVGAPSDHPEVIQAECGNTIVTNLKALETYKVSLSPSQTYVPLGGGLVNLVAKITKSNGDPLVGATVRFSATKEEGGAPVGVLGGSGEKHDLAVTDSKGIAFISLSSGTETCAVSLEAILMEGDHDTKTNESQEVIFGLPTEEAVEPDNGDDI